MTTASTRFRRFDRLDVIRFVAVLLVIGRHQALDPAIPDTTWTWIAQTWYRGGWVGVDLFFVLSGFLVTGLLLREHQLHGTVRVGRFLARRALKIYPAFYLLLVVTVAVKVAGPGTVAWGAVLSEALFVQSYGPYLWEHTWSLAVEEHFYLVLAGVVLLLVRRRSVRPFDALPRGVLVLVSVVLLGRLLAGATGSSFSYRAHLVPTAVRIDSLAFGTLLAYAFHLGPRTWIEQGRRHRLLWTVVGITLLVPAFVWSLDTHRSLSTVGFTVFSLAGGALVWAAVCAGGPLSPLLRPLAGLGRHSYSIYLWHVPVQHWLMPALGENLGRPTHDGVMTLLYVVVSLGVGVSMARLIEYPMLRLRDRFWPSRTVVLAAS